MLVYSSTTRRTFHEKTGQNLIFAQCVMKNGNIRNIIICSVGIVDYFVGYTAYFFKDDTSSKNKPLWVNKFFSKLMDRVNHSTDSNDPNS
jgi:deoxyhypusine synthase